MADTAFEPDSYEPRLLCALLDVDIVPESVAVARLDIRWFASGEFSIHYVETGSDGSQWECRWNRHLDHNTRVHSHQPPDCTSVTDLSLPSFHPLAVYSTVHDALEQRLETQWTIDS